MPAGLQTRLLGLWRGALVELGPTWEIYRNPLLPYSEALLSAIPQPDPQRKPQRIILEGSVPSPLNKPAGCSFHTRCRYQQPICSEAAPELRKLRPGRRVACHLAKELDLVGTSETNIMERLGLARDMARPSAETGSAEQESSRARP